MTESKFSTIMKAGREHLAVVNSRVREGLEGRSKQVIGIVALAGIAGMGVGAASLAHPTTVTPVAVASTAGVTVDRQSAADRANRDARAEATKSPSAKATTPAAGKKATPKTSAPKTTTKSTPKAVVPAPKAAAPKPKYANPLPGAAVTSCYGQRWGVLHAGIDFAASENTPIHAVVGGTVVNAGWAFSGYGISVVVDHGNGQLTHYAHMNKTAVKVGQRVQAGAVLGYEGSTGDSTGPHLHFEVHKGMWNQINPAGWLAERGIKTNC